MDLNEILTDKAQHFWAVVYDADNVAAFKENLTRNGYRIDDSFAIGRPGYQMTSFAVSRQ